MKAYQNSPYKLPGSSGHQAIHPAMTRPCASACVTLGGTATSLLLGTAVLLLLPHVHVRLVLAREWYLLAHCQPMAMRLSFVWGMWGMSLGRTTCMSVTHACINVWCSLELWCRLGTAGAMGAKPVVLLLPRP